MFFRIVNIVLLTSEYHTEANRAAGISRAFGKLARWLAEHGHAVTVLIHGPDDVTFQERERLVVRRFATQPRLHWRLRGLLYRVLPAAARDRLWFRETADTAADLIAALRRDGRCDVVLASSTLVSRLLARRGHPPVVVRLQHPWERCLRAEFRSSTAASRANGRLERTVARRATRVYAPSRLGADNFRGLRPEEIPVIRTPMFPMEEPKSWAVVRDQYQLPENFVLFFGGLLGTKGAHILADALPAFMAENPGWSVVACGRVSAAPGGGKMDAYLRRRAGASAKHLCILPALEHAELFALIRQCRFVVLPSVLDNLPNALLEAMYFGKLVVGSRGASIDEVIEDGVDGLLATTGDASDLACVMSKAARLSTAETDAIGNRAAEKCRKLFDPDHVVQQVVDLCKQAADR